MQRESRRNRALVSLLVAVTVVATACTDDEGDTPAAKSAEGASREPAKACEGKLAADQTLRLNTFFQPPNFDPAQSPGNFGPNALVRQYSEALLKLNEKGTDVTGAAAERFETSPDGLTYTFHLREDGRYNDGEPVRAADFVNGWRRLVDPRQATAQGSTFTRFVAGGSALASLDPKADPGQIDVALNGLGLEAPDERTFVVRLSAPADDFKYLATATVGAPVRRDVVERHGSDTWATKPETTITNGPFKVAAYTPRQSVTLVPNPHYREKPMLEKIEAVQLSGTDLAAAWTRYLNGELDVSNGPPTPSYDAAIKDPQLADEILNYEEPSVEWLTFNTRKPPFDDPAVRLAVARAIDRQAYAKETSKPYTSLVPEGIPGYRSANSAVQQFAPDEAKAILAASRAAGGGLGEVHLLTRGFTAPSAQFVQDQLKRHLGFNLIIDQSEDYEALLEQGNFESYGPDYGFGASYPDPRGFFEAFLSDDPSNVSKWSNAKYDELVRTAGATVERDERMRLYQDAEKILVEEAPVAFMTQTMRYFWVKPWVKGLVSTPFDDANFPGGIYATKICIAEH